MCVEQATSGEGLICVYLLVPLLVWGIFARFLASIAKVMVGIQLVTCTKSIVSIESLERILGLCQMVTKWLDVYNFARFSEPLCTVNVLPMLIMSAQFFHFSGLWMSVEKRNRSSALWDYVEKLFAFKHFKVSI